MPDRRITVLLAAATVATGGAVAAVAMEGADGSRAAAVAERGAKVMPFSLDATTHVFDATAQGGTQRVVAKDPDDTREIQLIREHLRKEADAFSRGDFADPAVIHGDDMPGLETLQAGYEAIDVQYRDLPDGAEITYGTDDPDLAAAVRAWFDAQLTDHAGDAASADDSGEDHTSHSDHED